MIQWTETARRTLDEYCARSRAALAGTGADTDEVIDDLRRHVDEEVCAAKLTVVTEADVRRILERVGEPGSAVERKGENVPPESASPAKSGREGKTKPGFTLLVLGVVFPLITIVFELWTGMSAGVLFDPFPSWFQVALVALVPVTNLWIWIAGRARNTRPAAWLGWLNGIAIGVCVFYAILYLPFFPIACAGVVVFGLGLIPLGPFFALLATLRLRVAYRRRIGDAKLSGGWKGALAAFGILMLLQLPSAATYYGLAEVASENSETRLHGVKVLRSYGERELMLRACYGLLRREMDMDLVRSAAGGNRDINADQAREAYYRVTGKPFNSVPPPALYTRMGRWALLDEFTWDDALGGDAVAGRVKGLSLASSRMDAVAEPDAALVYCEWTMEFKNVSRQQREARAQIALPPGAVVSRVTLWIDDEEREAAFGGRAQTRKAYQEVAVVQRRDPILVTTCGPDRVLMQCFPVQPDGGTMKVRIGITAPLVLESLEQGRFAWPQFLERNFGMGENLKHALWIESSTRLTGGKDAPVSSQPGARQFTFRETVSEAELVSSPRIVEIHRATETGTVWTPTDEPGRIIRQTIQPLPSVMPSRLVVVLDGSEGMGSSARELAEAFSSLPETVELAVITASDLSKGFPADLLKSTPAAIKGVQRSLDRIHFVGGQDNIPALEAAWDLASAVDYGVVLWIHEPQPALLSSESGLRQRIERTAAPTRLLELQIRNGPDRVVEKLDGLGAVEHLTYSGRLRSDFEKLLARWAGKSRGFELVREQAAVATETASGVRVSKHIERLWARDEALRLAAKRQRNDAVRLAARNQLVTPLTGAVVLETKEQYDRHNLDPADPTTVPTIPEPSVFSLMGVGILMLLKLRSKHKRR